MINPSQNYAVSFVIWDHTVLLVPEKQTHHALTQPVRLILDLPLQRDGRLSLPRCSDYAQAGNRTCDHLIESPTP